MDEASEDVIHANNRDEEDAKQRANEANGADSEGTNGNGTNGNGTNGNGTNDKDGDDRQGAASSTQKEIPKFINPTNMNFKITKKLIRKCTAEGW